MRRIVAHDRAVGCVIVEMAVGADPQGARPLGTQLAAGMGHQGLAAPGHQSLVGLAAMGCAHAPGLPARQDQSIKHFS